MKKLRVGIIFGGKTGEYDISLRSAKNIFDKIDKNLFDIVLLEISKQGCWYIHDVKNCFNGIKNPVQILLHPLEKKIYYISSDTSKCLTDIKDLLLIANKIDVAFPIVHGPIGEDGSLQGIFRTVNLPFVGSDIQSSAACMNKDITKRLLRDAGFYVAPFFLLTRCHKDKYTFNDISSSLGLPLFVKPTNQGSSIGVSCINTETEFNNALCFAFKYYHHVIVEKKIYGREIECAILGNEKPQASTCGEIVYTHGFYSYSSKYDNIGNSFIMAPAEIDSDINNLIRKISLQAYKVLGCCGMARVDVFLTKNNQIIINEVNTLPGFTEVSMYPKLWKASGMNVSDLITSLIKLSIERHTNSYV